MKFDHVIDTRELRDLRLVACNMAGRLHVMPASFYAQTTVTERAALGHRTAAYLLPTTELVDYLVTMIGGRTAIEIGSGSGVLAEAVGITATDSHQQAVPAVAAWYREHGQPTITYGPKVERLDARMAVAKYTPQVVVGAWVTQKYDPKRPDDGGNEWGINEGAIVDAVETYIFIGNEKVHANKPIWSRPHVITYPSWLYSRAANGSRDFVAIFGKLV